METSEASEQFAEESMELEGEESEITSVCFLFVLYIEEQTKIIGKQGDNDRLVRT